MKQDFTSSGTSEAERGRQVLAHVDFATGSGAGSAHLEVMLDDEWVRSDVIFTDDPVSGAFMSTPTAQDASANQLQFRWNVTVTGGTITTRLKAL